MIATILQKLRQFASDTRGGASLELIIFTPLLFTMLAGAYVYYDAYRQKSININAAYTISDALSRETDAVDDAYLDGLHGMLDFLTHADTQVGLRVTMVRWNAHENLYLSDWSKTRGPLYPLHNRDLNTTLTAYLPTLLHNERVIVVETSTVYSPTFAVPGLTGDQELYNFAFTRPRFAPKLEWAGS
ncbi:hypothetical protein [Marinovum sp.]|uniref:TadE/TadG family type IV pilus assembly protein n=1 Tax=Marinovum sp. TaxID=2024839 RepID=UPI002B27AC7C|nr:hypothetical protein [Marinovum sp.]